MEDEEEEEEGLNKTSNNIHKCAEYTTSRVERQYAPRYYYYTRDLSACTPGRGSSVVTSHRSLSSAQLRHRRRTRLLSSATGRISDFVVATRTRTREGKLGIPGLRDELNTLFMIKKM